MKFRDILFNLLIGFAIIMFVFVISALESAPMWILWIAFIVVWLIYILILLRDYAREKRARPLFWIKIKDDWRAIAQDGSLIPLERTPKLPPRNEALYDQEESN